jgi:hypothetical protein
LKTADPLSEGTSESALQKNPPKKDGGTDSIAFFGFTETATAKPNRYEPRNRNRFTKTQ